MIINLLLLLLFSIKTIVGIVGNVVKGGNVEDNSDRTNILVTIGERALEGLIKLKLPAPTPRPVAHHDDALLGLFLQRLEGPDP